MVDLKHSDDDHDMDWYGRNVDMSPKECDHDWTTREYGRLGFTFIETYCSKCGAVLGEKVK